MNNIIEYSEKFFENIKHIDENGVNIGKRENYKRYWNIRNGEILRRL